MNNEGALLKTGTGAIKIRLNGSIAASTTVTMPSETCLMTLPYENDDQP